MRITFLGAAETVTGSKFLLSHGNKNVLVDCGLFQGYKPLRERNWEKLPIGAHSIDAIILTHAHIDHSGYIPRLVKDGFKGNIYCSEGTFDLCRILLPDSGHIHEEDANRANRYGYTKHHPALPLYTEREARRSLKQFKVVPIGQTYKIGEELNFTLNRAGHILGSTFVTVSDGYGSIVFSGDLGRYDDPIMKDPAQIQKADYIVVESTYGDRLHGKEDPEEEIGAIIRETIGGGGNVVIPAFAVGRAQSILYHIYRLKEAGTIPDIPVYLDSPMSINATKLLCKHSNEIRLSKGMCADVCGVADYVQTVEESKAINRNNVPKIIISASGMATGGRVLHHMKNNITDHKNTIMFTGFQAGGTRGDRLIRGEKEIKLHGELFPVKARIANIDGLSAHADYKEILRWLGYFQSPPRKVFIIHGQLEASEALKEKIENTLGWNAVVAKHMQQEEL